MEHSFDVDVAKEYGLNCAILFRNISFWVSHNEANNKHYHDGLYWTFNSNKAFSELFPYLSEKQIRTALEKLEKEELIKTGNYNKSAYDRTKWYAITEKGKCILKKGQMEFPKRANRISEKGKPIPDNNTNSNTGEKKSFPTGKSGADAPPSLSLEWDLTEEECATGMRVF
jgi:hypothetical protein